jgi:hypothetical protein
MSVFIELDASQWEVVIISFTKCFPEVIEAAIGIVSIKYVIPVRYCKGQFKVIYIVGREESFMYWFILMRVSLYRDF